MSDSSSDSDSSSKIDERPSKSKKSSTVSSKDKKGKGKAIHPDTLSDSDDLMSDGEVAAGAGSRAGTKTSSNYAPPRKMKVVKMSEASSQFDFDRLLADPKLELWAIRIPDSIKSRHLSGLTIDLPSSSTKELTGSLSTKTADYTVQSASALGGTAEELASMKVLVPSQKREAYVVAPRPITTTLVLTPLASSSLTTTSHPSSTIQPTSTGPSKLYTPRVKPPRVQPVDKLKFRNKPSGYGTELPLRVDAPVPAGGEEEEVEIVEAVEAVPKVVVEEVAEEGGKKKTSKKRKAPVGAVGEPGLEGEEKKKKKKKVKKEE